MGKREIVLVLSMLLLLISSSEGQSVNQFDYFQVLFQWQPATCSSSTQCVKTPQNRYSIGGVRPSLKSGSPTRCSGTPAYDARQMSTIQTRMNQDWPSLLHAQNPTLWMNEWRTHGTCSNSKLNQLNYFTFGLNQFSNHNLQSFLNEFSIKPDGTEYLRGNVETAIYCKTRKWPALRCNQNSSSRRQQLSEIALCFGKNNRALINCPTNAVTCGDRFFWNQLTNPTIASD